MTSTISRIGVFLIVIWFVQLFWLWPLPSDKLPVLLDEFRQSLANTPDWMLDADVGMEHTARQLYQSTLDDPSTLEFGLWFAWTSHLILIVAGCVSGILLVRRHLIGIVLLFVSMAGYFLLTDFPVTIYNLLIKNAESVSQFFNLLRIVGSNFTILYLNMLVPAVLIFSTIVVICSYIMSRKKESGNATV